MLGSVAGVDISALYRDGRERILSLAATMSADQAAAAVPACPGWTVKDVYAHLTGVVDDALAGRMDGVTTAPWTARQVDTRSGRSLTEVCDEWAALGPELDRVLGDGTPPELIIDLWTHEQDVRGALGIAGGRHAPQVAFSLRALLAAFARGWEEAGRRPVAVVGEHERWLLGSGEPEATLSASDFELLRALMGRRSRRQFLALQWDGDGDRFVDDLHAFALAAHDLIE
jgi:uncharacterized protein (TIGR03083 family)